MFQVFLLRVFEKAAECIIFLDREEIAVASIRVPDLAVPRIGVSPQYEDAFAIGKGLT